MTARTRNILLAQLGVIGLLLVVGEHFAGEYIDPTNDRILQLTKPNPSNCLLRDPQRGMRYRPNCTGLGMDGMLIHTNELGLRDEPVRDDGAIRILAIGDSCTFGWGVQPDQAYPQQLARRLDERFGPNVYRVINAGIPGYTSYQGLVYLRDEGLALHPRIVIFGYDFNDQTPDGDIEESIAHSAGLMSLLLVNDALNWHSALWRWLEARQGATPQPKREPRVSADKYKRNLQALADTARAHGAQPLMLVFGRPQYTKHREMAWQVHRESDVPIVVYGGPKVDLVHPTLEGYGELAEQVFEALDGANYLEPGQRPPGAAS